MRIQHRAACPDVAPTLCAEQEIPVHQHRQGIDWMRAAPTLNLGLGRGWQASLGLPFELRRLSISYTTLDGQPYAPPYGDTHHRAELLAGPADGRALLWRYGMPSDWLLLGFGAGASLPLGRTEDNPFALAAQGEQHEHFQLGSGTADPLLSALALLVGPRWGAWFSADLRLPAYANGRGYRPPRALNLTAGPTYKLLPRLQLIATADLVHETPEAWDGAAFGGRQAVSGSAIALLTVSPALVLQGSGRTTLWQRSLSVRDEEPLRQGLVVSAGLSWTPPSRQGDH